MNVYFALTPFYRTFVTYKHAGNSATVRSMKTSARQMRIILMLCEVSVIAETTSAAGKIQY